MVQTPGPRALNIFHNLQNYDEPNAAIREILRKSADSTQYLTDEEVVRLGVWIIRPENTNLYGLSHCLPPHMRFPPNTQGLFRVEIHDENQFFWEWDMDKWDYETTSVVTSQIGNKILKKLDCVERVNKAIHRTIYKIDDRHGTIIVLVLFQTRPVSDDDQEIDDEE